jgi:hypothetical protein
MLVRYNNSSHLGTSRSYYLILTLQKSDALWIEISDALFDISEEFNILPYQEL